MASVPNGFWKRHLDKIGVGGSLQMRYFGQVLHRKGLVEIPFRVGKDGLNPVRLRLQLKEG
jgi:hypothetical protein